MNLLESGKSFKKRIPDIIISDLTGDAGRGHQNRLLRRERAFASITIAASGMFLLGIDYDLLPDLLIQVKKNSVKL